MVFPNFNIIKKNENSSNSRLLNINLISAEDILEGNKTKRFTDCFALIYLTDLRGRQIKTEKIKTKLIRSEYLNGQLIINFNEIHQLGKSFNLDLTENFPTIFIELYHSSQYSVNEVPLGVCSYDLSEVPVITPDSGLTPPVYKLPLEPFGRMQTVKGFVNVSFSFNSEASESFDIENQNASSSGEEVEENEEEESEFVKEEKFPNELKIRLIRAKNLPLMEKNIFGNPISTNARVSLIVNSNENKRLFKHRSSIQKKTINPVYDESITLNNQIINSYTKDSNLLNNIPIASNLGTTINQAAGFSSSGSTSIAFTSITSLVVEVKEASDLINIKSNLIGTCLIQLDPFLKSPIKKGKNKLKQWYILYNKDFLADGINRGEIELEFEWKYKEENQIQVNELKTKEVLNDKKKKNNPFFKLKDGLNTLLKLESDSDLTASEDDEFDQGDVSERRGVADKVDDKLKKEEEEKKKKQEEEKKAELENIDIKDGDYQIQVHIIECRDLKPKNLNGTSDPVVFISCMDEKRYTKIKKNVVSCVFDDLFILNFKGVTKETIENEIVKISCYDSGILSKKNNLIGNFSIDLATVYTRNKNHEFYREWVALINDEDLEDDSSIQGYMKLSISVIGPNDKKVVHNELDDIKKEQAKESACGSDIGSLILTTPIIIKTYKYIVVKLYKAEALPVMDGKIGTSFATIRRSGTDAFVKLSFGGSKPLKSKVVTIHGESRLQINPVFNAELWFPVSVPTLTQLIKISVYDKDSTEDELIGILVEKYNEIMKNSNEGNKKKKELKWYNLYGSPEFKTEKLGANIKKGLENVVQKTIQNFGDEINWENHYNNVPSRASTYKGRLLLNVRIEDKPPQGMDPLVVKSFRLKLPELKLKSYPETSFYTLQALIFNGAELPSFGFGGICNDNLRIRVSIGINDVSTRPVKCDNGTCRWNEVVELNSIELPSDINQIPDIFVYLVRDDLKPVCFARFKPYTIVEDEEGNKTNQFIGFNTEAKWTLFQEDKVINALSDNSFPGSVLINLRFGLTANKGNSITELKETLNKIKKATPYKMRIHIYQARDLMPKARSKSNAANTTGEGGADAPSNTASFANSNGLIDPYLKISFMGTTIKTKRKKKTNNPSFFETYSINNITINDYNDFIYSNPIYFRVYDSNLISGDTYLGQCSYYLTDAVVCKNHYVNPQDPTTWNDIEFSKERKDSPVEEINKDTGSIQYNYPDPVWRSFFYERPGDGNGYLLVHVDLIRADSMTDMKDEEEKKKFTIAPIIPETREGFIELIIIGMRELAPFNFQAIQNSFLEIELNSFGTKYKSFTNNSKYPAPTDPNFLETIIMPCRLPMKSIYSTPLLIKAKDSRLGGYLKPIIGVCQIDLTSKLPWDLLTYKPPQQDIFISNKTLLESDDVNNQEYLNKLNNLIPDIEKIKEEDDFVMQNEPIKVKKLINEFQEEEDNGAGIFGALNYINFYGVNKKKKQATDFFAKDLDLLDEEVEEAPPKWIVNRDTLDDSLESVFLTTPFETYSLTRGSYNSAIKSVGRLKGLVRVVESEEEIKNNPMLPSNLMDYLMKPKKYHIRLYCLKATQLDELDKDIFGNRSKSDPYIKVKLGKQLFDDRSNAVDNATDIDLYKVVEMETELPGVSQLNISFYNKNMISSDDLIGRTFIDLEDRWFDSRWQQYGEENMVVPGQLDVNSDNNNDIKNTIRWKTKPIERRFLYAPGFSLDRGIFECWLDIMTAEEAATFPVDDIALPPRQKFEVRVVIWKTKNVPAMDSFEGMSDLFVKAWPEGCKPLETDTHWRCKNGKASFNWRLKFEVELGNNTKAMKFPYFYIQLWDRDILKWNDCAGEGVLNLGKYYRKAYRNNVAIKLFEKKKGLAAKRAKKMKDNIYLDQILIDDNDEIPDEEDAEQGELDDTEIDLKKTRDDLAKEGLFHEPSVTKEQELYKRINHVDRETRDSDDDDDFETYEFEQIADDGDYGHGLLGHVDTTTSKKKKKMPKYGNMIKKLPQERKLRKVSTEELKQREEEKRLKMEAKNNKSFFQKLLFWKKEPVKEADEIDENAPLLFKKSRTEEKEDKDDELKSFVNTIKNLTGLWDIDPDDSAWYHLEQRDPKDPSKVTPMGSICYSIQIWPKVLSDAMPVGGARNEPNTNPFLPPPVGRFRFSFNPFVLGSELCGPVLCAKFFCCLLCLAFLALMIFCQPFLNIIINLIFVVY